MSSLTSRIVGVLGAVLLVAALPTMAAEQDINSLSVEQTDEYGRYLVTGEGQPIYIFMADEQGSGQSTCYGQCADTWPPVTTAGEVTKESTAILETLIQTIERKDGAEQVTYNGWPLYLFVRDGGAGGPTGQGVMGFGGEWYLVQPSGEPVTNASSDYMAEESDAGAVAVDYGYFTQMEGAFNKADENDDGAISRTEWNGEAHRIFGLLDNDGDGVISEEEYGFLPEPAVLP